MKAFEFEKKKTTGGFEPLPAGGYVAQIMKAEVITYDWGEVLNIAFDIAEGLHKGHFIDAWNSDTRSDKKWKGNFRLTVPNPSNQYFDSQKRTFGNAIACIEESNGAYVWDWNETGLKGKYIGVLFRNKEYDFNGFHGWTTECCAIASVEDIRNENYRMPKDKPLAENSNAVAPPVGFTSDGSDEDLPF